MNESVARYGGYFQAVTPLRRDNLSPIGVPLPECTGAGKDFQSARLVTQRPAFSVKMFKFLPLRAY